MQAAASSGTGSTSDGGDNTDVVTADDLILDVFQEDAGLWEVGGAK